MISWLRFCLEVVRELRRIDDYNGNAPVPYRLTAKAERELEAADRRRWN